MKVYYSGNYWGGHKYEHAGKEIVVSKKFEWGGKRWYLPSIYICAKGLVVDFCVEVKNELIEEFIRKINQRNLSAVNNEDYVQIELENPLSANVHIKAVINGRESKKSSMCSVCWHTYKTDQENGDGVSEELMDYYKCDRRHGWIFLRFSFSWPTARKPQLREISLTLAEEALGYQAEHFVTDELCDSREITLTHPVSKEKYILKLHKCENITLPENKYDLFPNLQFPGYGKAITYSIVPDVPHEEFRIADCARGDSPRQKSDLGAKSAKDSVCSYGTIGIIGSADGPTAIVMSDRFSGKENIRVACSSLHFEPVSKIEWKSIFYIKKNDDYKLNISF